MRKMLNGYLLCKEVERETESGFEIEKLANKFKELEVVKSNEQDVAEGYKVLVHVSTGEPLEHEGSPYVVIEKRSIVSII